MMFNSVIQILAQEYKVDKGNEFYKDLCDLQELLPIRYSLWELNYLWTTFSETRSAGFLCVNEDNINDFIEWIKMED